MAELGDGAAGAFGVGGVAAGLAKRDEVAIPSFPVFDWEDAAKLHFRLQGRFCFDEAEPVANAVNMHIDADGGEVKADSDGEIGGFASDARKLAEFLDSIWEDAAEALAQDDGELL